MAEIMNFDPEKVVRYSLRLGTVVEVDPKGVIVNATDYDSLLELYRASQRAVAHGLETME